MNKPKKMLDEKGWVGWCMGWFKLITNPIENKSPGNLFE